MGIQGIGTGFPRKITDTKRDTMAHVKLASVHLVARFFQTF